MTMYSEFHTGMPVDEANFSSRLESFFSGAPMLEKTWVDYDAGGTGNRHKATEDSLIHEFDVAMAEVTGATPPEPITAALYTGYYHHSDDINHAEQFELTYDEPAYVSPYDKAFTLVRSLEAQLESADPNQVHGIKVALRDANAKWDIEKERALDDRQRKIQLISRWRAENPDSYNATRRKVRTVANANLSDMTPEQQAAHKKTVGADQRWKLRKAQQGWTPEQIKTGMNKRVEKRQQKEKTNV